MPKISPDLPIGSVLNSWTVLEQHPKKGEMNYRCRCVCGAEKVIPKSNLRLGKSKSCGKGMCKVMVIKHGLTNHPLYSVWCGIKSRLANPTGSNACYAGIKLCVEWGEFEVFYNWAISSGYTAGLSIDREERTGDYTPTNCRWTDTVVQSQNHSGWEGKSLPKGVYKTKPRNGEIKYAGTGKAPYYWIVIYKGKRHQKAGYITPEDAQQGRAEFIKDNYDGLVYPD